MFALNNEEVCTPSFSFFCIVDSYDMCRRFPKGALRIFLSKNFLGDGRRCEPEGCNVVNNCDVNAQCIPDPRDTSRYLCRCNRGFEGDGTVCIRRGNHKTNSLSVCYTSNTLYIKLRRVQNKDLRNCQKHSHL